MRIGLAVGLRGKRQCVGSGERVFARLDLMMMCNVSGRDLGLGARPPDLGR